jgi:acyl-CoA synthetase (AMP-forming)/AMP-acid ligase II
MFIQGGFNVYPSEVEGVIAGHAGVLMVAGIGVPDPVLGEVGRYYIVIRPGASVSEEDCSRIAASSSLTTSCRASWCFAPSCR